MKRMALSALFAVALAPAAFAMIPAQLLSASDLAEIRQMVPSADLSNLTAGQAAALAAALYSDDSNGGQIRAILN